MSNNMLYLGLVLCLTAVVITGLILQYKAGKDIDEDE